MSAGRHATIRSLTLAPAAAECGEVWRAERRKITMMDFKPPPMASAAIERSDAHMHQIHLEPVQPHVVLIQQPVLGTGLIALAVCRAVPFRPKCASCDWKSGSWERKTIV